MVPDRAIMPLAVALMGGFICGLLDSILQIQGDPVITLAVAGAVASALAGVASVAGVQGEHRASVAILRAFYAAALFLCIDLGLQAFLRDGKALLAFVLILAAAGSAGMLISARVGDPADPHEPRGGAPQPQA